MPNPKESYSLSKTGWEYVTKINIDLFSSSIMSEGIDEYGKLLYFPEYIKRKDMILSITLDGDIYISKDQIEPYREALKNNFAKFRTHLLSTKKYYENLLKCGRKIYQIKDFTK
ncbi:MAG: hypothetical protein V1891_00805 [bacterium]